MKNRLKEALELRDMKQSELSRLCGIKKASINAWYHNNWQPKKEALVKMAKVLNVSEDWLSGYYFDVPLKCEDIVPKILNEVRDIMEYHQKGLSGYFSISEDDWEELEDRLLGLVYENGNE